MKVVSALKSGNIPTMPIVSKIKRCKKLAAKLVSSSGLISSAPKYGGVSAEPGRTEEDATYAGHHLMKTLIQIMLAPERTAHAHFMRPVSHTAGQNAEASRESLE